MLENNLLPELRTVVIQCVIEIIQAIWGKIIMNNEDKSSMDWSSKVWEFA